MKASKGKNVAAVSVAFGVVALIAAAYASRCSLLERWHIHKLGSLNRETRISAAVSLEETGSAKAMLPLLDTLANGNSVWRNAPDGKPFLISIDNVEPKVQLYQKEARACLEAMRRIIHRSGDACIPELVKGLKSGNRIARWLALVLVPELGARAQAVAPLLIEAAKENEPTIRLAAIEALEQVRRGALAVESER